MTKSSDIDLWINLFENINNHFNIEELKDLCFRLEDTLGIDYDSLRGESKKDKVRELVRYSKRHGRGEVLLTTVQKLRTHVDWPKFTESAQIDQRPEKVKVRLVLEGELVGSELVKSEILSKLVANILDISPSQVSVTEIKSGSTEFLAGMDPEDIIELITKLFSDNESLHQLVKILRLLGQVDLSGSDLTLANLSGKTLPGVNLSEANLSAANLSEINLSGANLTAAILSRADLRRATLDGANLTNAIVSNDQLSQVKSLKGATLPNGTVHTGPVSVLRSQPQRKPTSELVDILINYFDKSELKLLCFELSIDYDELKPGGKRVKAMELVQYLERHHRISELIQIGRQERPDVHWPDASPALSETRDR